jgi:diguanylate cyclase (GGDEF)-like protein
MLIVAKEKGRAMIRKDYDTMILKRIEKSFDRIMPMGAIVAFASAVAVYYSNVPRKFVTYDLVVGFIFVLLAALKGKFSAQQKIYITIWVTIAIGVLSFMDGGYFSAGLQLIMISNIMAVMLVSKKQSAAIAYISIGVFLCLYAYYVMVSPTGIVDMEFTLWVIQFLVFVIYLFILHTVVYSIRDYLLENIEELEDSVETTYSLAYYDQLTGIANQNKFKKDLKDLVTKEGTGYMIIINVRNLNVINSIYNDGVGDKVLVKIAQYMQNNCRQDELIARISGNEFAYWNVCDNSVALRERMSELKDDFFDQFHIPHMSKSVTFNVSYMKHMRGSDIEETFHKAKLALTYAKTQAEPTIIPYNESLEAILREEELLKERLEKALEERRFHVHYQGKYNTKTGQLVGVEALARYSDQYGVISPVLFIPKLEEMNCAVVFGERMIKQVFSDYIGICEKYKREVSVAINISPSQLMNDGFVLFIRHEIIKYEIRPSQVILEITEDLMINRVDIVKDRIDQLKEIGFKIALDDFGSGYSSLSYLTIFKFDEVKIDKTFVDQIKVSDRVDRMIELIVDLSKDYQLNIVAEGVETAEQYEKLSSMGCHEVQGFYFSKPEPL